MPEPLTTQSFTPGALLLYAIERMKIQKIFDSDPYKSRRSAMKGSRLLKALVFYRLIIAPSARVLIDAVEDSLDAKVHAGWGRGAQYLVEFVIRAPE